MTHNKDQTSPLPAPSWLLSRRAFLPLLAAGGLSCLMPQQVMSQIRVEINSGVFRPIKIAFAPLGGAPELAQELNTIVRNDLESCGFFTFLNPGSFLESASLDKIPNFTSWRPLGAELLVVGQVYETGSTLQIDFRLWDVTIGQALAAKRLTTGADGRRRLGHILSDAIYTRLTSEGGYFDSRIAFIDETRGSEQRSKRLAIMDSDGANPVYLTDGRTLSITPRFSPDGNRLAYVAIEDKGQGIYLVDLRSGSQRAISDSSELTLAPRFSPEGQHLVFARQSGGSASLFELDINSGKPRRLTNSEAIDTAPCYSPDGRAIAFESDRSGQQQIYIIGRDGSGLRRLSNNRARYSTPVWSPKGDLIAFTRLYKGQFSIGVMKPDGSGERLLTSGFHNEGPTFSPNGRVIMFFSEKNGRSGLWSVDISGRNLRAIKTTASASDPSWSPLLG